MKNRGRTGSISGMNLKIIRIITRCYTALKSGSSRKKERQNPELIRSWTPLGRLCARMSEPPPAVRFWSRIVQFETNREEDRMNAICWWWSRSSMKKLWCNFNELCAKKKRHKIKAADTYEKRVQFQSVGESMRRSKTFEDARLMGRSSVLKRLDDFRWAILDVFSTSYRQIRRRWFKVKIKGNRTSAV